MKEKTLTGSASNVNTLEGKKDKWVQGFICAICTLIQLNRGVSKDIREAFIAGIGKYSIKILIQKGVDGFDLDLLKKNWKQLHKTKNQ